MAVFKSLYSTNKGLRTIFDSFSNMFWPSTLDKNIPRNALTKNMNENLGLSQKLGDTGFIAISKSGHG